MTQLIALLSVGKGSWIEVKKLISQENWEKVFLITNTFGKEKFQSGSNTELLIFDLNKPCNFLVDDFISEFKGKVKGFEVAVNLSSGSGNEHMALLASLIKLGVGFRIVIAGDSSVKVLT